MSTGVSEAFTAAGLSYGLPSLPPGFRQTPVPNTAPIPSLLEAADCVCVVERSPEAYDLSVEFQSACQRVADPSTVDVVVLLKGSGTYNWDDTNSGFSVDDGTTWYALEPETGDPLQSPLTGVAVDNDYLYTMVLDMDDHIDDFSGQDRVDYLITFAAV